MKNFLLKIQLVLSLLVLFSCKENKLEEFRDENKLISIDIYSYEGKISLNPSIEGNGINFKIPYSFDTTKETLEWEAEISKGAFIEPNYNKSTLNLSENKEIIITSESGLENIYKLNYTKNEPLKGSITDFYIINKNTKDTIETISGNKSLKIIENEIKDTIPLHDYNILQSNIVTPNLNLIEVIKPKQEDLSGSTPQEYFVIGEDNKYTLYLTK